jgi:hypothetical protein
MLNWAKAKKNIFIDKPVCPYTYYIIIIIVTIAVNSKLNLREDFGNEKGSAFLRYYGAFAPVGKVINRNRSGGSTGICLE